MDNTSLSFDSRMKFPPDLQSYSDRLEGGLFAQTRVLNLRSAPFCFSRHTNDHPRLLFSCTSLLLSVSALFYPTNTLLTGICTTVENGVSLHSFRLFRDKTRFSSCERRCAAIWYSFDVVVIWRTDTTRLSLRRVFSRESSAAVVEQPNV